MAARDATAAAQLWTRHSLRAEEPPETDANSFRGLLFSNRWRCFPRRFSESSRASARARRRRGINNRGKWRLLTLRVGVCCALRDGVTVMLTRCVRVWSSFETCYKAIVLFDGGSVCWEKGIYNRSTLSLFYNIFCISWMLYGMAPEAYTTPDARLAKT